MEEKDLIKPGDYVLIVSKKDDEYLVRIEEKGNFSTHKGFIDYNLIVGKPFGSIVRTHLATEYFLFKPTVYDFLRHIKRKTQVLYAKDLGYIILRLGIRSGIKMIECGSGSGSATSAFAFALYPDGKLFSYEAREEFMELAKKNLDRLGLTEVVSFKNKDIEDGFDENAVDAIFLDVKFPEKYIGHCYKSLKNSGNLCVFVPTANQVSDTLKALENHRFFKTDVLEIFLRKYKTVAERLRPDDTMIAHTGYLIFTRKYVGEENE
ncbi:MAG: tRNA (adenine-N1)-methyltransferase [Proteobacteria bacterium]|nr:tRNA (adenine-N1)-methyltransferase [Pseudomonadota bacterium]